MEAYLYGVAVALAIGVINLIARCSSSPQQESPRTTLESSGGE